jgi:hypothetical protein
MPNNVISRDTRDVLLVSGIGAAVYLLLIGINWDANGIAMAQIAENGWLAWPNHMLFETTGAIGIKIGALFGRPLKPAYPLFQVLTAVYGGLALGVLVATARRLGADRLQSIAGAVWLGSTFAFWRWSTHVAYVNLAVLVAGLAVFLVWKKGSARRAALVGIVTALAVLVWQANVFLLPIVLLGSWLHSETKSFAYRNSLVLFASFTSTITIAYALMLLYVGRWELDYIITFLTTHGVGGTSPMWGKWGWDRLPVLLKTWIQSIAGTGPQHSGWFVASWASAVFILIPFASLFKRRDRRASLFCLFGIVAYLPFIAWWDPSETKWLLLPNLFLTLFAAVSWSALNSRRFPYTRHLPVVAAGLLFLSNLFLHAVPAHTEMSQAVQTGECVAAKLKPSDLYVSTDWDFDGYMSYRYQTDTISMIGIADGLKYDKTATFDAVAEKVANRMRSGASVYAVDPLLAEPVRFAVLNNTLGITPSELDQLLPGELAFTCPGWPIRKVRGSR